MIETDVAFQLKGTHQKIIQMMQRKIDEYGLTFGLVHLMMLIEKYPNSSQKRLAKEMRFTQGAMSSVVKRLLNINMIKQIPLEEDMRFNRLVLTEKGRSLIDDYRDHIFERYESIFYGFTEDELNQLHDYLLRINHNLENMNTDNNLSNFKK